jgi:hypothetical protein
VPQGDRRIRDAIFLRRLRPGLEPRHDGRHDRSLFFSCPRMSLAHRGALVAWNGAQVNTLVTHSVFIIPWSHHLRRYLNLNGFQRRDPCQKRGKMGQGVSCSFTRCILQIENDCVRSWVTKVTERKQESPKVLGQQRRPHKTQFRRQTKGRRRRVSGGEGGIRTHGTLRYTAFRVRRTRPLCDLSTGHYGRTFIRPQGPTGQLFHPTAVDNVRGRAERF